jgi:Transglutaminase-like superfamily/TgpA N-terminal domain
MWNACWLPSIPMPEPINTRLEQFILFVLVCVGVAAFGTAFDQPLVWIFWLPCVVSVFWRIQRVPAWLGTGARFLAHIFETLALVLGLIFMAYPVLSTETATRLTLLAGFGLSLFASLFLLGTPVWPRASTLFPATVGLLVVACLNPGAKHRPLLVGAGAAVFAYLSLPILARGVRKVPSAQWMRLAGFAFVSALVAATSIVVVPRLQSQTENMTFQFFQTNITAYSGLSDATRLGDLAELKLSSRVVMRVWTDRPQDLRARAYAHFDGRGWTARPGTSTSLRAVGLDAIPGGKIRGWLEQIPGSTYSVFGPEPCQISNSCVRTRIIQNVFNNGMMVSPGNKLLVRAALPSLRVDAQENIQPPSAGGAEIYGILNRYRGDRVQAGEASGQELKEALELPEKTDPRVHELATRLAEGASSPREKLRRTVDYLQHEYHYTLTVGSFHTSQPVAEFLFEKKKGYCQYFAGAAAVLLRQQGVATRYVSGFHVTENNRSGDHYVVREMDAHAWIESYIPGEGWVQADPTPAAEYESLHARLGRGWFARALEWWQAKIAVFLVRMRGGDWRTGLRWLWEQTKVSLRGFAFIGSGLTPAVIVLVWRLRYLRRRKLLQQNRATSVQFQSVESAPELAQLLGHLDAYWTKCGVARPAHRAPLEHLESITAEKVSPDICRASRHLIETYYLASFGGMALPTEELRTLQREFDCLFGTNPIPRRQ